MSTTSEKALEVSQEAVKELSAIEKYLDNLFPKILSFGLRAILALVLFYVGHKIVNWIRRMTNLTMEKTEVDTGLSQFIDSLLKFGLHAVLILIIVSMFGVESTSIAALVASCGMAVSLALQGSLSNFAGGVLILLLKPFVVGDYIIEDANKNEGTVEEIGIFYTRLATIDNKSIILPNGTLANTSLTNVTAQDCRQLDLKINISYKSNLKLAKDILSYIIENEEKILQDKETNVFVDTLGDNSIILGLRAWVKTEEYWDTRWRMLENIKLLFDENDIEIPFRQLRIQVDSQEES